MDWYADRQDAPRYVITFESEVRRMAGHAVAHSTIEIGGTANGSLTQGGRPVVHLVLPHGPKARCGVSEFVDDADHISKTSQVLYEHYGIQLLGTYHSHYTLGLDRPSNTDTNQAQRISRHSNVGWWLQLILTLNPRRQLSDHSPVWNPAGAAHAMGPFDVRINSFLYVDARCGQAVRCGLRVIPGVSPMRQALAASGVLPDSSLDCEGFDFPMDRIHYDPIKSATEEDLDQNVLDELAGQCRELPDDLQQYLTFDVKQNLIVLTLPLSGPRTARIVWCAEDPSAVKAIYVEDAHDSEPRDVTADVTGHTRLRLNRVYERLISLGLAEPTVSAGYGKKSSASSPASNPAGTGQPLIRNRATHFNRRT